MSPRPVQVHAGGMRPLLPLVAPLLLLVGCGLAVDTPLGIAETPASVTPGEPVTGRVVNPDGDITVTIAAAGDVVDRYERPGSASACAYDDEQLACPTLGVPEGVHAIQVSDAAVPSELVRTAYVAVTDRPDYDPAVTTEPEAPPAGLPFLVVLTGWGPEQDLVVRVTQAGRPVERARLTTDGRGRAELEVPPADDAVHVVLVRDGLWGADGSPPFRAVAPQ